ncbi:hypothetical protein MLD38_028820 [Melastoma candidum]|uniref:Uncharacterized protein n=1 Tax=Melastoma candidum TaxID=119954 RepID=A0ACB9N6F8_9MYRT|nr:hypothetical protein MLD38_028820 [Melastoma candidum]
MVKKVNHNATERDRRKKINSLFSSLCSLLPPAEQAKKLSIPATITRVLKYIPELQEHIQLLTREKERLLSYAPYDLRCRSVDAEPKNDYPRAVTGSMVESMSWRSEREAMIRISQGDDSDKGISQALLDLENEGFSLISTSSFRSSEGKFMHDLHVWKGEDSRSPPNGQSILFQGQSSGSFDSEYLWPTVPSTSTLDFPNWLA